MEEADEIEKSTGNDDVAGRSLTHSEEGQERQFHLPAGRLSATLHLGPANVCYDTTAPRKRGMPAAMTEQEYQEIRAGVLRRRRVERLVEEACHSEMMRFQTVDEFMAFLNAVSVMELGDRHAGRDK